MLFVLRQLLSAIPTAIGALCLNEAGFNQFNERPHVIPRYFSIFASRRHAKVLSERENANLLGASIDELIRHHPSLKQQVLDATLATLRAIAELGNNFVPDSMDAYRLRAAALAEPAQQEKTPEQEAAVGGQPSTSQAADVPMQDAESAKKDAGGKDNYVLTLIKVVGEVRLGMRPWLGTACS